MDVSCGITRSEKYHNYVFCYPIPVSGRGRSDSSLIKVDGLNHVDPERVVQSEERIPN